MEPQKRRGGIGFMSTQKREGRYSPAARMCRPGETRRRRLSPRRGTERAGARGDFSPVRPARIACAGEDGEPYRKLCRELRETTSARPLEAAAWVKLAIHCNSFGTAPTAPYLSILGSIWFWMVTTFLLKDQPFRLSVRPVSEAEPPGSPPFRSAASGLPGSPGHPAIPFPSSHVSLHPALPQAPAKVRRAERYDGQGNLHFIHAA